MRDEVYPVPTANIALMEGGSNQKSQGSARDTFYAAAVTTANGVDGEPTAGLFVWNSDGYVNLGNASSGPQISNEDDYAQDQLWPI
jgi:hypothetical protein